MNGIILFISSMSSCALWGELRIICVNQRFDYYFRSRAISALSRFNWAISASMPSNFCSSRMYHGCIA